MEAPVNGTGLGTWVIQRIRYTQAPETDYYIPHAHNVYAQTLAEQGVIGAIAGVVVVGALAWLIRDAIRSDGTRRHWGVATFVGLVYFAAHQALDFNVNLPAVLTVLALPIAYLDATAAPGVAIPRFRWPSMLLRVASAAFAVAVAVSLSGLAWQEIPALANDRALGLANDGDWTDARAMAESAAAADPAIESYVFTAALAEAHAGNHAEAARLFREVALQNDLPEAWLNQAAEDLAAGRQDSVAASISSALRLGYQRPAVAIPAGELALRTRDRATAVFALAAGASSEPSFLADPWWSGDPGRKAIYDDVVAATALAAPGRRWEIALMSGDKTTAAAMAPDEASALFVAAWAGDDVSRQRLLAGCRVDPTDQTRLLFCARIARQAGDVEAANQFRYVADVQNTIGDTGGADVRVATGALTGRSLTGNPAIFWGTFTYRRPTPWDVLVPSLVHLTIE